MSARWREIRNAFRPALDPTTEWTTNPQVPLEFDIANSSLSGVGLWEPVDRLSFLGPADECGYVDGMVDRLWNAGSGRSNDVYFLRYGVLGITVYFDAYGWIRAFDIERSDTDSKRLGYTMPDGVSKSVPWSLLPLGLQRLLPLTKMHCMRARSTHASSVYRMNFGERSWLLYFRKPSGLTRIYCDTDPYQPTQDWPVDPEFRLSIRLDAPSINGLCAGKPIWVLHGLGASDPVAKDAAGVHMARISPGAKRSIAELYRAVQCATPAQNVFQWKQWGLSVSISKDENLIGFRICRPRTRADRHAAKRITFCCSQWQYDWESIATIDRIYSICGKPDWDSFFLRKFSGEAIMYTRNDGVTIFQFDECGRTIAVEGRAFPWNLYLNRASDFEDHLLQTLDRIQRPDDWGTGLPPREQPVPGFAIVNTALLSSGRLPNSVETRLKPLPRKRVVW
jgi:hypothetical protein